MKVDARLRMFLDQMGISRSDQFLIRNECGVEAVRSLQGRAVQMVEEEYRRFQEWRDRMVQSAGALHSRLLGAASRSLEEFERAIREVDPTFTLPLGGRVTHLDFSLRNRHGVHFVLELNTQHSRSGFVLSDPFDFRTATILALCAEILAELKVAAQAEFRTVFLQLKEAETDPERQKLLQAIEPFVGGMGQQALATLRFSVEAETNRDPARTYLMWYEMEIEEDE